MKDISLEFLDPRHDPEPPYWEELRAAAGQRAIWRYDLLRISAWAVRSPLVITVLRDGPRPIGVVCASLHGLPPNRGKYAAPAGRRLAGLFDVHAQGSRAQKGWWLRDRYSPAEIKEVLSGYARGIRDRLGPGWRGMVWREVSAMDREVLPGLVRLPCPTNPLMRLTVRWPDLEGWFAGLGKSRRRDLRRQARRISGSGLLPQLGLAQELLTAAEFAALKSANDLKYRSSVIPPVPTPLRYLETMISSPELIAITYRDECGKLAAAGLVLDHPEWPLYHAWGAVPVEQGGMRDLYFETYVRMVEWAISERKTGLIWGKGQTEIKRDLGAELVRSSAVAIPH